MDATYSVAGIDVHKKMLAAVVANVGDRELRFECRRFGTTVSELKNLSAWLREHTVQEAAELRSRRGATGLAYVNPYEIPTDARQGTAAKPTGKFAGRMSDQIIQCSE